jgi:hypothetical protein
LEDCGDGGTALAELQNIFLKQDIILKPPSEAAFKTDEPPRAVSRARQLSVKRRSLNSPLHRIP